MQEKGHFSSQCFTETVTVVGELPPTTDLDDMDDVAYLSTIDSDQGNAWTCHINVNGHDVSFKIDTGAEVTVISDNITKSIGLHQLHPPSKKLHGPDNRPLEVIGEATARLVYKGTECTQPIFVVRNVKQNLLGFHAIQALQILKDVNAVTQSIPEQLPTLFTGLGTLKGKPYEICLKPEAQPFALYTPRNVPLPLRQKVIEELSRMQSLGVISPVEEPTPWCAGMVVVPKKSGAVHICVDFQPLSDNVLRKVHPLPNVDENLAQLAGAQVFSKLDTNCGFWQIPLSEQSRMLTAFITPFGRFVFNKLSFGISSAPGHFQRRMQQIHNGQEGTICHMDDMLIHGRDQQEHDARLNGALKRIQEAGLILNPDKCKFSQDKLTFLGHVIDGRGISPDPSKTNAVLGMESPTNTTELRRFLGMVNQLGKFSAHLAELSQPLRELLSHKKGWLYGDPPKTRPSEPSKRNWPSPQHWPSTTSLPQPQFLPIPPPMVLVRYSSRSNLQDRGQQLPMPHVQ